MRYSIFALSALMGAHLFNEVTEGGEGSVGTDAPTPAEGSVRIRPDLAGYTKSKSASGSSTKICGDTASVALAGASLDETYGFVAKVTGVAEDVLRSKYSGANPGQQRMFLGNLIRPAMEDAKSPMKDAEKAGRIRTAFNEHLPAFRKGIDARLEADAKAAKDEKDRKAAEKQKAKDDKKAADAAKKAAEKPADNKGDAPKADKPAAARPAAPKAPAQPKQ